jgi:hypothetical protein
MTTASVSVDDVMRYEPCPPYPRERVERLFAPHGGRATLAEALALPIPSRDRYWLATRSGLYLSDSQLRLVACAVAESSLLRERAAGREPDARSWAVIEAGRAHARGEIDDAGLAAAREAAWAAAREARASRAAAREAWAAAWAASRAAAREAWEAAWEAPAERASSSSSSWAEAVKIVARVAGIDKGDSVSCPA